MIKKVKIKIPKKKLYIASAESKIETTIYTCFVSDGTSLKDEAHELLTSEIYDQIMRNKLKVSVKEVKTLEDVPTNWHNALPWNLDGDDHTVKQLIKNPELLSDDPEYKKYLTLKAKFEK